MWGDHSKREYRWSMLFICAVCTVTVLGSIFPFINDLVNSIIIGSIVVGVIVLVWKRIDEAREMHHALHAPVEELIKEDRENGIS